MATVTTYEDAIKVAVYSGVASYKISQPRRALVLSVNDGSSLVALMDEIFAKSLASLAVLKNNSPSPIPRMKIGRYKVIPLAKEKRVRDGLHHYDFTYTPK